MTVSFSTHGTHRLACTGTDSTKGIGASHIPYGKWKPESIVQTTSTRSAYNTLEGTKDALARILYGDRASHGDASRSLGRALLLLPRDAIKAVRRRISDYRRRMLAWLDGRRSVRFVGKWHPGVSGSRALLGSCSDNI